MQLVLADEKMLGFNFEVLLVANLKEKNKNEDNGLNNSIKHNRSCKLREQQAHDGDLESKYITSKIMV